MFMQQTVLITLPIDDFRNIISETVKEQLAQFRPIPEKEKWCFTRRKVANLLYILLLILNEKFKDGDIQGYYFDSKLLYSIKAIEEKLQNKKRREVNYVY